MASQKANNLPIQEKALLTIPEAAEYSHIGQNRIERMLKQKNCKFVFNNGNRRLVHREAFDEFLKRNLGNNHNLSL